MLLSYIRRKLEKRKAMRVFREYPHQVQDFQLEEDGLIQFANWQNPLIPPFVPNQSMVNFFRRFIPAGSLAIDIGANIGDTTVMMSLAAGRDGLVLGFDPNPHVFKVLEVNAALNKDKTNIVPLPFAIAREEGEFYYSSSEASFGNGGISDKPSRYHGSYTLPQKIRGIVLEDYLQKNYPERMSAVSLIKIDTEGYDKEIIKSIHPFIEKYKPVIISECFSKSTKAEREDLYDSLALKGYKLFYFEDFKADSPEQAISKEDMMKWRHFNIYALPAR